MVMGNSYICYEYLTKPEYVSGVGMKLLREYIRESIVNERVRGETMAQAQARNAREKERREDPATPSLSANRLKKDSNQSIKDAMLEVEQSGKIRKSELRTDKHMEFGLSLVPFYAAFNTLMRYLSDTGDINTGTTKLSQTDIDDFPLLDKFDIFEGYLRIFDQIVLRQITKEYLKVVVSKADESASVSSLEDINDFIPRFIAEKYKVTVAQ